MVFVMKEVVKIIRHLKKERGRVLKRVGLAKYNITNISTDELLVLLKFILSDAATELGISFDDTRLQGELYDPEV